MREEEKRRKTEERRLEALRESLVSLTSVDTYGCRLQVHHAADSNTSGWTRVWKHDSSIEWRTCTGSSMGEGEELHLVTFDREDKCSSYTGTEGLKSVAIVGQRG